MNHPEGVSLIICTYNGANRLTDTLSFVNRQVVDKDIPWEMIIIDNASDDASGEVARNSWKIDVPLRVIVESQKGLIHARHRGIREARYEYISFIDDDNWIDPDWIGNIYQIFRSHTEVGMCGGMSTGAFETPPPPWFSKFENSYAIGKQGKETGDITETRGQLWGAGLSFRKSAFERIKDVGFNSILTGRKGDQLMAGEDTELAFAFRLAGWKLWYSEDLTLQHFIPPERYKWDYVKKMYKGFGHSHAIFEIYKYVLSNARFNRLHFLLSVAYQFLPFIFWKALHPKKAYEGNKMDLLYVFHRHKFTGALSLFSDCKIINKRIIEFRDKVMLVPV